MRFIAAIGFILFFGKLFSLETNNTASFKQNKFFISALQETASKPNPVWFNFFKKQNNHKKIIASALAFPLPFGFLGIHRIYLGTKPYIPLIYVGTLGGAGLLSLIDFIILVSNKDISRFQNNPRIFMWVDNEIKK